MPLMSESLPVGGVVNLGFARIDSSRRERCGRPEVIFGQGKTAEEIARIASEIHEREGHVLATRVSPSRRSNSAPFSPDRFTMNGAAASLSGTLLPTVIIVPWGL